MQILAMGLNHYNFVDEKSGEVKEGLTLEYIKDRTDSKSDFGTKTGYFTMKQGVDLSLLPQLSVLPAWYSVDINMRSGADRKAQVVFDGFTFVKEVDFT